MLYNHPMKSIALLLFFYSFSISAGPLQEIKSLEQFDEYLTESHFNGVLLVADKDKILFKKAFGVKDFETNSPLSTEDKFLIGSVSKQFTAAALLKLQQEAKLSLDDDVVKHLPQLTQLNGITIRDVLNHTSGIADYTYQPPFWKMVDFNKILTFDEILDFTSQLPLDFSPKTKWNYSNSGYIVAGKTVEVVSGLSWDKYIKANFLEPLQMNKTGYAPYFKEVSDVKGHISSTGKLFLYEFNMSWILSAGALYSTLDDLLKWIAIYDTSELLSENSKTQMQTPFLNKYALGIGVEPFNNEIKISHNGRIPGFTTTLTYLKTSKLKLIKFDNTDGSNVDADEVALNFFAKGSASALKVKPYLMNKNILTEYVGVFVGEKKNLSVFIKDETLFLQPNDGQPAYPLVANDRDSFRLLSISGEEFIRNPAGQVIELKHYQGGGISVFRKGTGLDFKPVQNVKKENFLKIL